MNRNLWIAAAALVGMPLGRAEPLLSFGPDIPLFITGTATIRRDSNVFLAAQNPTGDTLFILDPGLDLHYSGGGASVGLLFDEQFVRYATNRALDDHLASVSGNLGFKGTTSQLTVAAAFQQEDQSTLSAVNTDQTLKHSQANASLNGEWGLTAKTSIGLGASFERTMYPEAGLTNSDAWSFPADLYYEVSPKVDLSAGYRFDKTTQDNGVGDTTDDFINVGARGDFTPKLSGQIRVGVSTLMPAKGGGSNTTEPGLGMTLDYLLSPRTTLSLSADNGFTASALGTSQEELMINTSASFQLSQAWSASLGASFDSTKYLMVLPPRKDYFWVGDVGLSYAWTKYTAVQLSYFFRRNDSTLDAATFSDDVLTLSASSRF
jgi:polysaccharide biosynthesis protein VpsM